MSNLSQHDKTKLNDFNSMSVGEIFKKTRLQHGYDLKQIVEHLNIGTDHLEAIENNDEAHLPPKVYAIGFVRAYADALGLDSEKMVYLFKLQIYGKKQIEDQKKFIKPEGKDLGFTSIIASKKEIIFVGLAFCVLVGLAIATLSFLIMWIMAPSDDTSMAVPPVPQSMLAEIGNGESDFVMPQDTELNVKEPMDLIIRPEGEGRAFGVEALSAALVLRIVQDISAEIRLIADGSVIVSDIIRAGDVVYMSEGQDILVSATNGAGIEVYLDGQNLGLLAQEGQEVRMRALSVEALRLINAQ